MPAPTALPTSTTTRSSTPFPAPAVRSPHAAAASSQANVIGSFGARACNSFCSGTSFHPRLADVTSPVRFSRCPAIATPSARASPIGKPAAPHAVFAARTTASATCGGSRESVRCRSCPRTRPAPSTTAARTVLPLNSMPTVTSSRARMADGRAYQA